MHAMIAVATTVAVCLTTPRSCTWSATAPSLRCLATPFPSGSPRI